MRPSPSDLEKKAKETLRSAVADRVEAEPHTVAALGSGSIRNKIAAFQNRLASSPQPALSVEKPDGEGGSGAPAPLPVGFEPASGKHGLYSVLGTRRLQVKKQEIPGTDFDEVCPIQEHVSHKIVMEKVDGWQASPPDEIEVGVFVSSGDKLVLAGDSHHKFVAAIMAGVPVLLKLCKVPGPGGGKFSTEHTSWSKCTWEDFKKGDRWVK